MYDPVFMFVLLVGCLALGGSLIMMCVVIHVRESACRNVACSYHPQSLRAGKDFSQMATPEELLSTPAPKREGGREVARVATKPALKEAARGAAGPTLGEGANKESIEKEGVRRETTRTERLRALPSLDRPQPPYAATTAGMMGELDDDELVVDEPRVNPLMDFTDDMVQQVLAALRRQEERQLQLQAEQQRLQKQQRLMLRRQLRQTQRPQRTFLSFGTVPAKVFEKERTGQRAAIEWLVADQRRNQPALQAR